MPKCVYCGEEAFVHPKQRGKITPVCKKPECRKKRKRDYNKKWKAGNRERLKQAEISGRPADAKTCSKCGKPIKRGTECDSCRKIEYHIEKSRREFAEIMAAKKREKTLPLIDGPVRKKEVGDENIDFNDKAVWCLRYDMCLEQADAKNWPAFSCRRCIRFEKEKARALRLADVGMSTVEGYLSSI